MSLTKARDTQCTAGNKRTFLVGADTEIFEGGIVVLNSSGFAEPGTSASGKTTVGMAFDSVDNTDGLDGYASVVVCVSNGVTDFYFDNDGTSAVVQATVGKPCYVKDDATVSSDGTSRSVAGTVTGFYGTQVAVRFAL